MYWPPEYGPSLAISMTTRAFGCVVENGLEEIELAA
jgi:hypothetical protein